MDKEIEVKISKISSAFRNVFMTFGETHKIFLKEQRLISISPLLLPLYDAVWDFLSETYTSVW